MTTPDSSTKYCDGIITDVQQAVREKMQEVGRDISSPAQWSRNYGATLRTLKDAVNRELTRLANEERSAVAAYSGWLSTFSRSAENRPPEWAALSSEEQDRWRNLATPSKEKVNGDQDRS